MKADLITEQVSLSHLRDGDYVIWDNELVRMGGNAHYNRHTYAWTLSAYDRKEPIEIFQAPENDSPMITRVSAVIRL